MTLRVTTQLKTIPWTWTRQVALRSLTLTSTMYDKKITIMLVFLVNCNRKTFFVNNGLQIIVWLGLLLPSLDCFRLACILVLQSRWQEFLVLMGICCSTFVSISRGSTHRSEFLPEGCPVGLAVYRANKGLCRLGLGFENPIKSGSIL